MLNPIMLETAQMLEQHPIIYEKESYKCKYINVLEYFVRKYSKDDLWARETLQLYIKKILGRTESYQYKNFDLHNDSKSVLATKFRPFKIFSYRYCLIYDCIFLCAYEDRKKAEQIFSELSSIYHKRYLKKIRQVFESLYNPDNSLGEIEQIRDMQYCWNKNREFIQKKPLKVIITANMSAGKSTLLNAFVGKKVNKTQNDACTAKVHKIVNKPYEDGFCYEWDYLLELDADEHTLMEDNSDNNSFQITVGTFFRTLQEEPKRIWLIDTPGVNSSQNLEHKILTEKTICETDANVLIYLLNGENIGTDDDRRYLQYISEYYHGELLFVVNKVDRFRKNEDNIGKTIQAVISDLKEIGFQTPTVVPVSAYAAYLAKMKVFGENLNDDEQDEYDLMSRKMKKTEYQLEQYYPQNIKNNVHIDCTKDSDQLLLHSGLLHLEYMIYNL